MISTRTLGEVDPEVGRLIALEAERKELSLEMIPSENCVSDAVLEAVGSVMMDKYCEGYPGKRYYGGCQYYDEIETLAINRAVELFGAEFANVQPHSGANANMAAFLALISPGDTILGPRLDHGGHLTHGSPVNFSGKWFKVAAYGVHPETHLFDEAEIMRLAREHRPKLIICGATAYARQIDWKVFRAAADEVGAKVVADVSHYAGLIAGGAYDNPTALVDLVTTTTHKTLRGPRGGMVLGRSSYAKAVNKSVFPLLQGGPLMHQIAGKAVAFGEALTGEFKVYARQVVSNARTLAASLEGYGFKLIGGGTDSHLLLVDVRPLNITGTEGENALGAVGITVNKNTIPNDPLPPAVTSGVRLGTPTLTTRGLNETDMREVGRLIWSAIEYRNDSQKVAQLREEVKELCRSRPMSPHRIKRYS